MGGGDGTEFDGHECGEATAAGKSRQAAKPTGSLGGDQDEGRDGSSGGVEGVGADPGEEERDATAEYATVQPGHTSELGEAHCSNLDNRRRTS